MSERVLSLNELKRARETAALVVERYGEAYLPIFERADAEVKAHEQVAATLERVRVIARQARIS